MFGLFVAVLVCVVATADATCDGTGITLANANYMGLASPSATAAIGDQLDFTCEHAAVYGGAPRDVTYTCADHGGVDEFRTTDAYACPENAPRMVYGTCTETGTNPNCVALASQVEHVCTGMAGCAFTPDVQCDGLRAYHSKLGDAKLSAARSGAAVVDQDGNPFNVVDHTAGFCDTVSGDLAVGGDVTLTGLTGGHGFNIKGLAHVKTAALLRTHEVQVLNTAKDSEIGGTLSIRADGEASFPGELRVSDTGAVRGDAAITEFQGDVAVTSHLQVKSLGEKDPVSFRSCCVDEVAGANGKIACTTAACGAIAGSAPAATYKRAGGDVSADGATVASLVLARESTVLSVGEFESSNVVVEVKSLHVTSVPSDPSAAAVAAAGEFEVRATPAVTTCNVANAGDCLLQGQMDDTLLSGGAVVGGTLTVAAAGLKIEGVYDAASGGDPAVSAKLPTSHVAFVTGGGGSTGASDADRPPVAGHLIVVGDLRHDHGHVLVDGDVGADSAEIEGKLVIAGATTVAGTTTLTKGLSAEGGLRVDGTTTVSTPDSSDATAPSRSPVADVLFVTAGDTANNVVTFSSTSTAGTIAVAQAGSAAGGLVVTGDASFTEALEIVSAAGMTVGGAARFTGETQVAGDVEITGAATIKGGLSVTGTVDVDGPVQIGGTLGLTDATKTHGFNGKAVAEQSVTIGGTLRATAGVTADSVQIDGAAAFANSVRVQGSATLTSDLKVGDAVVVGDLEVDGPAALGGGSADNVLAGKAEIRGDVTVDGQARVDGDLALAGAARLKAPLAVTGAAPAASTLAGKLLVKQDATVAGTLTVAGTVSVNGEVSYIRGAAQAAEAVAKSGEIQGELKAEEDVQVVGNLEVTGTTSVVGTLMAAGGAVVTGDVMMLASLNVDEDVNIAGDLDVYGRLTATGDIVGSGVDSAARMIAGISLAMNIIMCCVFVGTLGGAGGNAAMTSPDDMAK